MPALHKHGSAPTEALPPSEVRFTELRVEPWPDGRRVRVHITLTPFQQNPSLEAVLSDAHGHPLTSTSIIETAENRMVFTLHLRPAVAGVPYHLSVEILYSEIGVVDQRSISFEVDPAAGEEI